jgi:hypothetical protein
MRCERMKHVFIVLQKYKIIIQHLEVIKHMVENVFPQSKPDG